MPELHIERVFKLRNYPAIDIRAVISSTEGAVMGTSQTGGAMQITMQTPRAMMITAGVYARLGAPRPELPKFVTKVIQDISKSLGKSVCFASLYSISCTIENTTVTQEEALRILEEIGKRFEQQVEHIEYFTPAGARFPVVAEQVNIRLCPYCEREAPQQFGNRHLGRYWHEQCWQAWQKEWAKEYGLQEARA